MSQSLVFITLREKLSDKERVRRGHVDLVQLQNGISHDGRKTPSPDSIRFNEVMFCVDNFL